MHRYLNREVVASRFVNYQRSMTLGQLPGRKITYCGRQVCNVVIFLCARLCFILHLLAGMPALLAVMHIPFVSETSKLMLKQEEFKSLGVTPQLELRLSWSDVSSSLLKVLWRFDEYHCFAWTNEHPPTSTHTKYKYIKGSNAYTSRKDIHRAYCCWCCCCGLG